MSATLDSQFENEEYRKIFAQEALLNTVQEMLARWMVEKNISKADLARRLDKTRSAVTQMLGGQNITIRTLAGAVYALGGVAHFEIEDEERQSDSCLSPRVAGAYFLDVATVPKSEYTSIVVPLRVATCPEDDCWEEAA